MMPKYLVQISYTAEGTRGLMSEGGTKRRDAIETLLSSMGAKLEAFYYSLGDQDLVAIVDAATHVDLSSVLLRVMASGTATTKTTCLLTPQEMDWATQTTVPYKAPGAEESTLRP